MTEDFDSLADENWCILIDDYDVNEPTICYPDTDRPGAFVGPLVKVHVGTTVENEDGDEVLELDGAEGRNLYAVACLPQLAGLLRWMKGGMASLNPVHFDGQHEYGRFMRELRDRIAWIEGCINDRQMEIGPGSGSIGFEKFEGTRTNHQPEQPR